VTADDLSGGTFTITNPGPFGRFITVPVINQLQVAIASTDGISKRPIAVELPDGSDVTKLIFENTGLLERAVSPIPSSPARCPVSGGRLMSWVVSADLVRPGAGSRR
jgi:hypothetical protein